MQGTTLEWISSYLIGRAQAVVLDGGSSDEMSVTAVVPQGSVLGPILFLLYINSLPENIQSQICLFADHTAVYLALGKQNGPQQLQEDLNLFQKSEQLQLK